MTREVHQSPSHRAYTVVKRGEGQDDYWLNIGAAFPHQDGKGFNVVLQALPTDAKIVMREVTEQAEGAPAESGTRGHVGRGR